MFMDKSEEIEKLKRELGLARRDYEVMNKLREGAEEERDAALEREQALAEMFEELKQIFGIGEGVTSTGVVLTNARNSSRFSDLLHTIEMEFFMVPGEPDEDYPDEEPAPECLLNCWGSTKSEYINQFGKALDRRNLIKQAEVLEGFAKQLPKFDHMGVEKALILKARELRQQAAAL